MTTHAATMHRLSTKVPHASPIRDHAPVHPLPAPASRAPRRRERMRCIMGRVHRDAILDALPPGGRMLEWGSGGSTSYFADNLPPGATLLSIEHDPAWHHQVAGVIGESDRLTLRLVPAEGPLGRNATDEEEDPRPLRKYIHAADADGPFDVILVDGYARGSCLARARELLKPGGVVFLHDAQRPWYDQAKLSCGLAQWGCIGSCPDYPTAHLWCAGNEPLPAAPPGAELPVIVSFYTAGTPYEQEARNLIASCRELGLKHEIIGVPPLGSWEENCSFKARFISEAWSRIGKPLLWVDADAIIRRPPTHLAGCPADFAVHKHEGWLFNSATLYFNQTPEAEDLLGRWRRRCLENPKVWDQITLDLAWEEAVRDRPLRTLWLPAAYAKIFDHADAAASGPDLDGAGPVIEQFQASRRHKAATSGGVRGPDQRSHPTVRPARLASRLRTPEEMAAADAPAPAGAESAHDLLAMIERLAGQARALVGSSPAGAGAAAAARPGELADLRRRLADAELARDRLRQRLVEAVARRCADAGHRRIALFGAGRHTPRLTRQPWNSHDLEIVAILDDEPKVESIRGVPVVRPERADIPFDAVVVSSDAHERAIFDRATALFAQRKIPVLRIYGDDPASEDAAAVQRRLVERWGLSESDARWLVENRAERHDANLPMLPPERTELHLRRYELALPYAAGKRVVDCACGVGYGAAMLLEQGGAGSVVGLDIDPRAVDYASRRYGRVGLTFRTASATATGLADRWADVVTSFETIEHVEDPAAAIDELARILVRGGTLILSTPNDWGVTEHHAHSFTRESLAALLEPRFADLRWFGQRTAGVPTMAPPAAGIEPATHDAAGVETLIVVARKR